MRGFTLIELLVALAILSAAFLYLIPNIGNVFQKKGNTDITKLDKVVQYAYKSALRSGLPQAITGVIGSNNIKFGKKVYSLSQDVSDAKINDKYHNGLEYKFFVYPCGIMDKVKLILYGNKEFVSFPLLLRFDVEQ